MKKIKAIILTLALAAFGLGDAYLIARETVKDSSSSRVVVKKICKTCNGSGKVDERVACSNCGGYGCGVCDWTGYKIIRVTCGECGGEGKIVTNN